MVTLEESRRFAVNYFKLASNVQAVAKIVGKQEKSAKTLNLEDPCYDHPLVYEQEINGLLTFYQKEMFPQLKYELENGFNLLFYGFGRKRFVIEAFKEEFTDDNFVFINGYDPLLTLTSVYSVFSAHGLDLKSTFNNRTTRDLTVLIYGLDAFKLRNDNFYRKLAKSAGSFRLIATVEDPSFSLLLNPVIVNQFNFIHHDMTTFLPYTEEELESLPEIISSRTSNKRSIKGALFVLQSLTPNARAIFKLLAEHQLSINKNSNAFITNHDSADESSDSESDSEEATCYSGLSAIELYKCAQEKFLISNEQAFKTIIGEFTDHELFKLAKSTVNGGEVYRIPFSDDNIGDILSVMATM